MLEEQRVALVHGLRPFDLDGGGAAHGGDGRHHGDAMVVAAAHATAVELVAALDHEGVTVDEHVGAELAELRCNRLETVAFLDAQAGASGKARGSLGACRHCSEGGDEVGDVAHVELYTVDVVRANRRGSGVALPLGAEQHERGADGAIALD